MWYDISFRDLSFNRLSGTIPSSYADMSNANFMYEIHRSIYAQFLLGVYF